MLGFDVDENEGRDFSTGRVTRNTSGKMQYPCLILESTAEKPVHRHSLEVLKKMFPVRRAYFGDEVLISVYFRQGSKTAKLGIIMPSQVKSFLRLFSDNKVLGYLDDGGELSGMYLYVLAD